MGDGCDLPTRYGNTGRREADDKRTNAPREGTEVSKVMAPASHFGARPRSATTSAIA